MLKFDLYKLSSANDIHVDNHQKPTYACMACGCVVFDKFKHAQVMHKSATPNIVNTFTDDDRMLKRKNSLIRKAGKKIEIVRKVEGTVI